MSTPQDPHNPTEEPSVTERYSEQQLDALRELANVAAGTAATALSQMLGR